MAQSGWTWATLTKPQLDRIGEAEQTLGANYVLAYRAEAGAPGGNAADLGLQVAPLNDSQRECLQGLEAQVGSVLVAYVRPR